jgi:hypothetical protein
LLAGDLSGCKSPVDDPNSTVPGTCSTTGPLIAAQKTDILFVIDDSDSMADSQAALSRELPTFIDQLYSGSGVTQDFRIGVVTTSIYQNANYGGVMIYTLYPLESGWLQPVPVALADGGTAPGTERILMAGDPNLVDKFKRLVRVGISGSGHETPFEAARLAVTTLADIPIAQRGNQGFLRDGAQLLVVVVMDEDDCSETRRPPLVWVAPDKDMAPNYPDYCYDQRANLTPVEDYYNIFTQLTDHTGAHRPVVWAEIAPVSVSTKLAQPFYEVQYLRIVDCPKSYGVGRRHRRMAELFDPTLNNLDSICNPSFHDTLLNIANLVTVNQTIELIGGVPDPRVMQAEIQRSDGTTTVCTTGNGGFTYEPPSAGGGAKINFQSTCPRRADDRSVELKMLCAG